MKHYYCYCFEGQTAPDTMYWLVLSNSIHQSKLAMMPCHVMTVLALHLDIYNCFFLFSHNYISVKEHQLWINLH